MKVCISTPEGPAAARWNLLFLAGGMAALYGMIQLAFGASTLTFEQTGGSKSLAGLAPAVFLACGALAAVPAGRAMDRRGPRLVLAAGFATGLVGSLIAGLGVATESLALALVGFAMTGLATGTILLSRAAAATMFAPAQRPRAIALVLFGAVFGALLGPLVFGPLLQGEDGSNLDLAWLGAAAFMLAGLLVASRLRPVAAESAGRSASGLDMPQVAPSAPGQPIRVMIARPGVAPALFAVLASLAAMVSVMALTGAALVDHGHAHDAVFPVLSAHFIGMFAFFAIVGRVIERIGRPRAMISGLLLMAASATALLAAVESIHFAGLVLLGIGLGWSLALVAATSELSERADPSERATLIGFADLLGGMSGAALVAVGGFALDTVGLVAITTGATLLPIAAAVSIALSNQPGVIATAESSAD